MTAARNLYRFLAALLFTAALSGLSAGRGHAATTSTTFTVSITITASCTVSATALNFGSVSLLTSAVDATSTIDVSCTDTTPYSVGLDAGGGSGATVATRLMTSGAATIDYSLYQDAARTIVWGDTVSTDTLAGTGSGSTQTLTVYGRVPAQTSPAPGTYSDTINVTITY